MHRFSQMITTALVLYPVFINVTAERLIKCNLVSDDKKQCFIKDMLLSADHNPNQIAVDKASNTLYFSFDAGQGEYNPALLNIETKKLKILRGVKDAYAIASNDSNGDMYFGGCNGIYKYIPLEKKLMRLHFRALDVWWLYIQDKIFYIQFPQLKAYVYAKKSNRPVKSIEGSIVRRLVYDFEKQLYFINASGAFLVKRNDRRPVKLNCSVFLGLAVDNVGKVYMCSDDGIYVVNTFKNHLVSRLVAVRGVMSMAFDQNNHLVYSDGHDLVRLLPVQKRQATAASMESEFRSVFVCHKACHVHKMRVYH